MGTTAALLFVQVSLAVAIDHGGYRPSYQGFGVTTSGGRGGMVLRVKNLNDAGPDSLRAAMEASGARFVIFETSGTIALNAPIIVLNPYMTVAGQSAPSPGINIKNYGIQIDTNDIVIQHLRFREGDLFRKPGEQPTILIGVGTPAEVAAHDIVIDHVSCAWSMYNCFENYDIDGIESGPHNSPYHPYNITFWSGLIAYDLRRDISIAGMGAYLVPISAIANGGVDNLGGITMARTLFVHNSHRQPLVGTGRRTQLVNNVVFGSMAVGDGTGNTDTQGAGIMLWQNDSLSGCNSCTNESSHSVFINNVYIPSTGTGSGNLSGSNANNKVFLFNFHPDNVTSQDNRVWLSGNTGPHITGPTGQGQKDSIYWNLEIGGADESAADIWYATAPSWHTNMNFDEIASGSTATSVFLTAGARPSDRDSVDTQAVAQARAGTIGDTPNMGSRIASQTDMGGWPTLAVNTRTLTVPANPNAVASGQSFRTNIEMWLESLAQALEEPPPQGPNSVLIY